MLAALGTAARHALEELMNDRNYEPMSDFAKEHRAKGRAGGRAEALLELLSARCIAVSEAERTEVLACRDVARLQRWLVRAANAQTIDEVLANE